MEGGGWRRNESSFATCSQISAFQHFSFQFSSPVRLALMLPVCCHLLPVVLPLKRLTDNDVTDVATLRSSISDAGLEI
jgi:hypothetical protein